MRFRVILENIGGELANELVTIDESKIGSRHIEDVVDSLASGVIDGFMLSVGDTIRIVEIE